jgi:hypothetical protein
MPYIQQWIPAPIDKSIPVLEEMPEGAREFSTGLSYRICHVKGIEYHYCPECKGWIEGSPNEFKVDTLAPLVGRRGIEYYCKRCGYELAFIGIMS